MVPEVFFSPLRDSQSRLRRSILSPPTRKKPLRRPSCNKMAQIPNKKVFYVRFVKPEGELEEEESHCPILILLKIALMNNLIFASPLRFLLCCKLPPLRHLGTLGTGSAARYAGSGSARPCEKFHFAIEVNVNFGMAERCP